MANVLVMPRQGNTVESCTLTRWRLAEGKSVGAEDIICEVETDKAAFEVPAGVAGVVLKLLVAEGDDVPVLSPIAVIGAAGEDWRTAAGSAAPATPGTPNIAPASESAAAAGVSPGTSQGLLPGVSPRARSLAADKAIDATLLTGSGPGGRVIERDVSDALEARPPLSAAALAAAKAGAPLPSGGSGLGGRIVTGDFASGAPAGPTAGTAGLAMGKVFPGGHVDTPIKGIRKIIADRMLESLSTTAQLTYNASAPAGRLLELRARMKAAPEALGLSKVTLNDLVLFAVSRVLVAMPQFNAHMLGDSLRTFERVHLGMAVDSPRGLMVPVIRNADLLSLAQISAEAKRLAVACLENRILPDELSGSTFTVTNLGSLGIESFTPVLNAPEVAILGVDNITLRPVMVEDAAGIAAAGITAASGGGGVVSFEPRLGISLTANHQVIDGAPAARFLKALSEALAGIDLWLAK